MSAFLPLHGTTPVDCWPMARVMAGMSAVPVGHAIDLAMFFPEQGAVRHDALIAETRRHLGGCLTAIETALRLSLDHDRTITMALDQADAPLCWPTIRALPTLLSPAILAHMQMRAGVSLMLRQCGQPGFDVGGDGAGEAPAILMPDDAVTGEVLAGLALAEARWVAPGGEAQAMRPDLPAEHYAELVWSALACMAAVVRRVMGDTHPDLSAVFERAGWALLGAHDETASPIAHADRVVRQLGDRADDPDILGLALGQSRFLLFAALAARRLRMTSAQVIDILVMAPIAQVANLCRALGGSDADYRYLLMALRPVRPDLSDMAVVVEAERYQVLDANDADAAVSALRAPAVFRAKLDHLLRVTGA